MIYWWRSNSTFLHVAPSLLHIYNKDHLWRDYSNDFSQVEEITVHVCVSLAWSLCLRGKIHNLPITLGAGQVGCTVLHGFILERVSVRIKNKTVISHSSGMSDQISKCILNIHTCEIIITLHFVIFQIFDLLVSFNYFKCWFKKDQTNTQTNKSVSKHFSLHWKHSYSSENVKDSILGKH